MYISGISLIVGLSGDVVALIQNWASSIDCPHQKAVSRKWLMSAVHISIYMNAAVLSPSLELCTSLYHGAKQREGLIWGFAATVTCYKNELLQISVLYLDPLNTKYHDFSFEKHLFSWPMPYFSAPSEHSLNTDNAEYVSLPTSFFIFTVHHNSRVHAGKLQSLIVHVGDRHDTVLKLKNKGVAKLTKCKALKKPFGKINSSRYKWHVVCIYSEASD